MLQLPLSPTTYSLPTLPFTLYVLFTSSRYDTPPRVLFSNTEGKGKKEQGVSCTIIYLH